MLKFQKNTYFLKFQHFLHIYIIFTHVKMMNENSFELSKIEKFKQNTKFWTFLAQTKMFKQSSKYQVFNS